MLAATDLSTVAALRYIAANYPENYNFWNDAALFLEFINNWFVILTISSSAAEKRFKDTRKATMRLDTEEMKRNISFLEQTSELMNQWANRQYYSSLKFSPDILKAVQLTSSTIAKATPDLQL